MLNNNIKIAFRNLRTHKFFTLLNVMGLALGMSGCLTLIVIIRDQLSYDHFHPNGDRTYRLISQQIGINGDERVSCATTPFPLGDKLLQDFSAAEKMTRIVRGIDNTDAKTAGGLTLPLTGYFAEPSFFDIFGFILENGNATTALAEPNTMVLTRRTARRFFGDQNPIGQTLDLGKWGIYTVTGIAARAPGKSHIGFECLASASSLPGIERSQQADKGGLRLTNDWENQWMTLTYVQLREGKTRQELNAALAIAAEQVSNLDEKTAKITLYSQPLAQITPPRETLANDIGFSLPLFILLPLGGFVLLLIVFPCLNYANLAIARALERAKEVGVRKVVGARERDLTALFLTESVLTALCALVIAWPMHRGINHFIETKFFAQINLRGSEPIALHADAAGWGCFVLFSVAVGLLAGWLPARRLSKMRTAAALRGHAGDAVLRKRRFGLRAVMTTGQFAVSLLFMILAGTLWRQVEYMALADYGFQKENLFTMPLQGNKAEMLSAEIAQYNRVTGVCASSILVAGNTLEATDIKSQPAADGQNVYYVKCDKNYVPVMNLRLLAGQNFQENGYSGRETSILLNEKAVGQFQLGTPAEAVGKTLWLNDTTPVMVAGVLADFHFRPLREAIEPFALRLLPQDCAVLQIRLAPGDPRQSRTALESIWKKIDPVHPFEGEFMESAMQQGYLDIQLLGGFIGFFAILGLSLACLGLLGMVTHIVGMRVKEIGVRRVLGASVNQVVLLLSRRFLWMLGIAVLLALPAGWWLSNLILQSYAYHAPLSVLMLLACAGVLLLFGLLAVGVQSVRAALANPAESLRSE